MQNPALAIDQQLSFSRAKLVAENRLKWQSIAATVIFCGRQAIAFPGYRDDTFVVINETSVNHGNFQALLQFRIDAGDHVLKVHLKTAGGNAVYTSKEAQNEMIVVTLSGIRSYRKFVKHSSI